MRSTFISIVIVMLAGCGLAMDNEDRLARGEQAMDEGDFRAAMIDAKEVLRREPESVRGRFLLGRASVAAGDGAAAEKELRKSLELGAARGDVVVPLGQALLLEGRFQQVVDEIEVTNAGSAEQQILLQLIRADAFIGLEQPAVARQIYSEILQLSPDRIDAMLGMAATHRAEKERQRMRELLDDVVSKYPDDVRGWLMLGELDFSEGNYAAADASLETAYRLVTNSNDQGAKVRVLTILTEVKFAQSDIDAARRLVGELVEVSPNSVRALYLSSRIAFLDEDWNTAQQNLQSILRAVPEHRPAQTLLGAVHLRSGNLAQAEMYLSSVIAAVPEHSDARRMLVETRLLMDKVREAEETLQPLVADRQSDSSTLALAARMKLVQGDSAAAIDYLRRLVEQDPANIDRQFDLAVALLNTGEMAEFQKVMDGIDPGGSLIDAFRRDLLAAISVQRSGGTGEALGAARKLTNDWPLNPNAHNFLGSVLLARDDLDAARASFDRSIELQPGDFVAQRNLALIDERQGDLESAKARYEAVLAAQQDATWAMFSLARIAARNEDLTAAHDWLQKIRSTDEKAIMPRATLTTLLINQGDFAEAQVVIDEALAVNESIAELHNLLGRVRMSEKNYTGAQAAFRRALELEPTNADYRVNLAQSQSVAGDTAIAEQTLTADGAVDLGHLRSAVAYVAMKVESGEYEEALRIARDLQKRHADNPIPVALEAEVFVRQKRLEAASEAYDRALAIDVVRNHAVRAHRIKTTLESADRRAPLEAYLEKRPLDYMVRLLLAESLQRDELLAESQRQYEQAMQQAPEHPVVLNNLAWTYYLAGDPRAEGLARQALMLAPDSGAIADTLGWILLESGNVDEGVDVLRQAVELAEGRAEVRYHYAVGLSRLGRNDEARQILHELVGSDEKFTSRREAERLLADM